MSETNDNVMPLETGHRLSDAIRAAKNAAADQDDVVVDMRDAERMRLELLAAELAPVIAEVPDEVDLFDFAISSGLQPRFWIDSVSHVGMGRDKRSYRFVKDTRNGRVVLAESPDIRPVADAVTRYVAERIVERERMMEDGAPVAYRPKVEESPAARQAAAVTRADADPGPAVGATAEAVKARSGGWKAALWGLTIFLLGGLAGFSVMATQWWEQITQRAAGQ